MYPRRPPVMIIGAHRSGTSATARALQLLGLQIGQHLDSHFEPYLLQRVQEDYLRRVGARWFEPRAFLEHLETHAGLRDCVDYLRAQLSARLFGYRNNAEGLWMRARLRFGAAWGWKEPRTTLFARAWLEIFPNARLLHLVRDPRAAGESIRARELKFQAAGDAPSGRIDNVDFATDLVLTYTEAGERLAASANYLRVHFEDLQADPSRVLNEMAQFCDLTFTPQELASAAATIRPASARSTSPKIDNPI
ncbi:MAG: hypothetical protein QOG48_1406 [Verrucomicrobiota bacterium]|jgi:hypothetical protein